MTTSLADPRRTSRPSRVPLVAAGAALAAIAATVAGLNIYWGHQRDLYQRFTSAYGDCLTGTAWDVRTAPGEIHLDGPPRLRMYGTGGQGVLVFAADTFVGSDRLHPADAATVQVLRDHQCSAG